MKLRNKVKTIARRIDECEKVLSGPQAMLKSIGPAEHRALLAQMYLSGKLPGDVGEPPVESAGEAAADEPKKTGVQQEEKPPSDNGGGR